MGQDYSRDPEPGDLIEIKRGVYQHWALYMGDGYVIHVTESSSSSHNGSTKGKKAKVKKELLKDVVRNNKWNVNNKYDRSCTPFPVEEIIRRAESWIDKEVDYDVVGSNCEHFVTKLRYEEEVSNQVRNAAIGGTAAATVGCILAGLGIALAKGLSKDKSAKQEKKYC